MPRPPVIPHESLVLAITAFMDPRTPSRIYASLKDEGREALRTRFWALPENLRTDVLAKATQMSERGIDAVLLGDDVFPDQLGQLATTSPVLFYRGNFDLLRVPGIGMCGSRNASEQGLTAAAACVREASKNGLVVISGYAKGVDTETHLAALRNDGKTVIVLAEGFDHFKIKRSFPRALFRDQDVLVISQFSPRQPWTAAGAMTRNKLIFGLGLALVVVEAGETGGTLAAGEGALAAGRPVFVLDFNGSTPPGNRQLLTKGGMPVATREQLGEELRKLQAERPGNQQLSLL